MNYLLLTFLFLLSTVLHAGGHVGNGGDIRRFRAQSALQELKYNLITFNTNKSDSKNQEHLKSVPAVLIENSRHLADWADHMAMYDDKNNSIECLTATSGINKYRPLIFNLNYINCDKNQSREFYLAKMGELFFKEVLKTTKSDHNLLENIIRFNLKCNSKPFDSKVSTFVSYDLSQVKNKNQFMNYLEDGRKIALDLLNVFNPELLPEIKGIDVNGDNAKKSILIRAKKLLPTELKQSLFIIRTELTSSCGATELKFLSPVYFSISECSGIKNEYEMAWVLIHEMVHHTGVDSEKYADFVASAILDFSNSTP